MPFMRAIRISEFGGTEKLKLQTKVDIPTPGRDEVLIKVSAAGINPVDTYIRSGTFSSRPGLPYTPGFDAAGIVEDVGSEVTEFKKGDRVYTLQTVSGAYAEYTTAKTTYVGHLDEKLTFNQGAAIGIPYCTAVKALHFRDQSRPAETVLIHGASGAVGIASVQIAKAYGLRVIGTAGTKEGMDLVEKTGADLVFNHREEGYIQAIQDAVGGVDIVLEMLANVNLEKDLDLINFRGRIMVIGSRRSIKFNPRVMMSKESTITGVSAFKATEAEFREMHSLLRAGQRLGWLKPKISKVYPLEDAGTAQHDVINNQGTLGKLVLDTTC
ncbi:quinone oxidoreductase [Plakobranchus ocellatus]|uniref:Quinone oxidoreductase n=1 Tax=Plakobranchus ocellatus TaxID=259542 RepID=A0AAV3ZMT6_9GAST|nr:quinone oxidoreductase [Plakobranchus ocellatus]